MDRDAAKAHSGGDFGSIAQFVVSRLADLRSLLNADVPIAKAEILRHVDKIDLVPVEVGGERFFMASGEWDLLGDYPSTKSVGAGGRKPTVLRLPVHFKTPLARLAA